MHQPLLSEQARRDLDSEEKVYATWSANVHRWSHVLSNPNAEYGQQCFFDMLEGAVNGRRVLEIGCGGGYVTARIAAYGASYALGTDISAEMIGAAKHSFGVAGTCEFQLLDAAIPFDGNFDVIVGKSVLHHLAYREVLLRLRRENLAPNGQMIFLEPLAPNLFMHLFRQFSGDAHTRDERPLTGSDIAWLRRSFRDFTFVPVNYVSIPLGAISSILFRSPDNALLHAADRIDRFIARNAHLLHTRFRYAVFSFK